MADSNLSETLRRDGPGLELGWRACLQRGQDAVEYALIVVLVALAITVSMLMLAQNLDQSYDDASACVTGTTVAGGSPAGGSPSTRGKGRPSQGGSPGACP